MKARTKPVRSRQVLHLGCGEDYQEDAINVDAVRAVDPDVVMDLNEMPWPFEDEQFEEVRANHVLEHLDHPRLVLEEIGRVLQPGGEACIRVPIGVDAIADPTHMHTWTWRTPEFYTGSRHWDANTGLELIHRDIRLWSHIPGYIGKAHTIALREALRQWKLGEWAFSLPATSGEFIIVFRRPE